MSDKPDYLSTPAASQFLQALGQMRQTVQTGRRLLPAHAVFKPDWNRYLQRLDNIERLFRLGPQNATLVQQLHEDFLLDYQADMATTLGETKGRMVRFTDELAKKFEEKKFELSSDARDDIEDLLQPYQDAHREQFLSELPIEERCAIEEAKRRLDEED
mgnify:FL=1